MEKFEIYNMRKQPVSKDWKANNCFSNIFYGFGD